jgi:hypothetical protein
MQVVFLAWILVMGMKDVLWEGGLEQAPVAAPGSTEASSIDLVAAEGPDSPPPPKP